MRRPQNGCSGSRSRHPRESGHGKRRPRSGYDPNRCRRRNEYEWSSVGLGTGTLGVVVGLGDQIVVLVLAGLGDFLGLVLALLHVLIVQLHSQGQHGGGALGLGARHGSGASDLLQRTGLGARLDLRNLSTKLVFTLLGFFELTGQLSDLSGLLLSGGTLLLSSGELTGQLLVGRAELITFLLNGGDLLTDSLLVTGGLSSLSGELIDLSVQLIDLTLELLILGGQRAVGFLGFAELGRDKLCCLIIASLNGLLGLSHSVLQTSILRLELLHLTGKIGDLRIKVGHVRTQSLGGLTAGYRLTSKSLDGFRDLIKEVIDLVDIITFLESNSLEGMLPNILRRQQSHKSCTSLWGIARTYVGLKSECYHDPIVSEHSTWVFMPDICLRRVKNGLRTLSEQHFPVPPAQNTAQ